jgi:hypothetical protein
MLLCKLEPVAQKVYHDPWSREIIPSQVSLVSTLCTQGLFYPCYRCYLRLCVEDRLLGSDGSLLRSLDIYFRCFNFAL